MKIRILLVAHSAVMHTGCAEILRNIFIQLLQNYPEKYEILQVGLFHISAVAEVPWKIISTQTTMRDGMEVLDEKDLNGEYTLPGVIDTFKPHFAFLYNDPTQIIKQLQCIQGHTATIAYVQIDGVLLPEMYRDMSTATRLVTMSRFSADVLYELIGQYGKRVDVVYAPADTDRFFPLTVNERRGLREKILPTGFEKALVIGWIGKNQWRKQLWLNYWLVSLLKDGRYRRCGKCTMVLPERGIEVYCPRCGDTELRIGVPLEGLVLWMHLPTGKTDNGDWDLESLERYYGLVDGKDVYYTPDCSRRAHIQREDMPKIFQCLDMLLFLSGGEGFGVPAWEAMCCGIPVIYSEYSSHGEFLNEAAAGIPVSGILQPAPPYSIMRYVSDIHSAIEAVLGIIESESLREELGSNGRKYVERFNKSRIASEWDRIFDDLYHEVDVADPMKVC
jgi:glycosyltransferase involved in cell wall biosynthesis